MQSALINVMSGAAIKAGKGMLRDFSEADQLQISRKGVSNFVTKTDIRTEKLLVKELEKARPDFGFLLEEGGEVAGKDQQFRWLIDPLDGTNNFIHAVPYFCTTIALEKRGANGASEIIAAVTYDPLHNDLYSAELGKGAFLNGRKLSVSNRDNIEDAMLVTGSLKHFVQNGNSAMVEIVAQYGGVMRFFGATALDLAQLAAGRIDACWYHSMKPWDVAAGLLLVKEAGGVVSQMNGEPATAYSQTLLATNRNLSLPVQKLLAKVA